MEESYMVELNNEEWRCPGDIQCLCALHFIVGSSDCVPFFAISRHTVILCNFLVGSDSPSKTLSRK